MQNKVLDPDWKQPARSVASRSVDRSLDRRRAAYADEVRRLVGASFALIRESGQLEPRVSEIVQAAGLSNHAFYKHFRSKDELLVAVLDDGIRQLSGYLLHRMEQAPSPREAIHCWIAALCEQALNPEAAAATRPFALSRARLGELFPAEVAESERQLTAMLQQAIRCAQEAGELPGADPESDAQHVYDLAMGWLQRKLAQPEGPRREEAQQLVDFALHGLARPAAGS